MQNRKAVIITRYPALAEIMIDDGVAPGDAPVLSHGRIADVKGADVFGILPLYLARRANSVTVADLSLPPELRGHEDLSHREIRQHLRGYSCYRVERYRTLDASGKDCSPDDN